MPEAITMGFVPVKEPAAAGRWSRGLEAVVDSRLEDPDVHNHHERYERAREIDDDAQRDGQDRGRHRTGTTQYPPEQNRSIPNVPSMGTTTVTAARALGALKGGPGSRLSE